MHAIMMAGKMKTSDHNPKNKLFQRLPQIAGFISEKPSEKSE